MPIVTIGIDLAKNVFAVHGVDESGKARLIKPRVPRDQLAGLIAQLPARLIGMEACSGAHHWARMFQQHGHTVKLMAPNLVAPYRMAGKRGKNDAADAAAICEAVTRPSMRFVPLKERVAPGQAPRQIPLAIISIRRGCSIRVPLARGREAVNASNGAIRRCFFCWWFCAISASRCARKGFSNRSRSCAT